MIGGPLARVVIVCLVLLGIATKTWAAPCVPGSSGACTLAAGAPAPYAGILMSETMADDLAEMPYRLRRLQADLELEQALRNADNRYSRTVITRLETALEDTPDPWYKSPWFWLGIIAAGVGGVVAGTHIR